MLSRWDITNNNENGKTRYSYWIPRGYALGFKKNVIFNVKYLILLTCKFHGEWIRSVNYVEKSRFGA
jgi:hypothetical protein